MNKVNSGLFAQQHTWYWDCFNILCVQNGIFLGDSHKIKKYL